MPIPLLPHARSPIRLITSHRAGGRARVWEEQARGFAAGGGGQPYSLTDTSVPRALIAPCHAAGTWGSVQAKSQRESSGERFTQP